MIGGISVSFVLRIVLLITADLVFSSWSDFTEALAKPEIPAAFRLTILSYTLAANLSLWVATPLGYLLSRLKFPGRAIVDTLVDIPIVLPPLVLGLSLLILLHLSIGGWGLETWLRDRVGFPVSYRWPAVVLAQFSVACALGESTRIEIQSLLREINRTTGVTIIHVTHSRDEAESLGDLRLELTTDDQNGTIVSIAPKC